MKHTGNDDVERLWVAVAEYVTNGRGQTRDVDPATGHAVMRVRGSLSFFPSTAIRRVAHLYHRCTGACKAVENTDGGRSVLQHTISSKGGDCYLYNDHFHITGT